MADKNPFDVELPKKSDNPFDIDIPIEKKNPVGNVSKVGTQTSKIGFEPFQNQADTKTPSVLTSKGKTEYQEQVKGYVPPKEVKQPKEEKPDFLESIKNSLSNIGTGVQQFIPNTQIALSSTLEGLLGKDLGSDFYRNIVGSTHNPELDRQEAYAKLAELEPQFKRTRGLIESAENFDVAGLAAATIDAMSSLVRTAITSIPTAGIGLASDMVGGSIASYNQEKAKSKGITVDELYRRGENEFAVPAAIGAVGTGLEAIGLKGTIGLINKQLQGAAAKKFATVFVDVNKEGLTEFLQTGLDASNNALSQGKSIEDAGKIAVKEMFSKKGLESYLMGTVGSAGASGLGRVVKGMLPANKKKAAEATQKIAELETELNNPNLSPATQKFIAENIKQNVSQIADAVENDANEIEGLPDEQKFTINSVNEIINSYEEVLSDPNASEQTKVLAQEKVNQLDLEIDNILNSKKLSDETQSLISEQVPQIAKPTFDSEEQIIAEGQQAQAEFEATGDQVTYEQKMKELDDRANQLIETLEAIEAPQRERGSHKIVKSEDNTTLDDMTKGGQLIPDDFYDKPQFYADINDAASKESLSVIKKAKGNPDAEITIYRAVPQGIKDIEEGDWVSLSPTYAKQHGLHPTDETQDMPVISMKVKAKDIVWDGNDVNEFAYFPISKPIKPQEDATKIRKIEQGRIGEYPRAIEQQQREQKDREDQEKLISEAEAEAGGRNRIVEGRQVEEDVIPKEEFATEEEVAQPAQEAPTIDALKDVESTTKALKDINFKDNKALDKVFESISPLGLKLEYNKDLILSKENEFDFGYDLQKYFGIRDNGYRKIGDAVIRIKDHTPNYNNFVEDVENGAKKIINVIYGDYNNTDRRKLKTDIDTFEQKYPNVEIIDVKIETGDNLENAIDIIRKDVLSEIAKEYQKGSDKRLVKAVEQSLKEEFATEEEYTLDRVDKENDPEELAALYYEQETPEPDYKMEGIMDYLGSKTRINLRDWNRWNDVNNLTPQLRRRYIDSNNKSGGLDQSAMELSEMLGVEVTEEDFIDAILEFGSTKAYKEKGLSKVQKAIADKYYEITGKNLTEGRAERAYLKIKNKPKTDKEIYELNESLQEIGITYEDIERYNEYAKQELKGVEKPIRKTEPVARAGRKVREEGERVQEEVEKVSKSIGASPKNIKDLYDINRNLFGLNRVKSLASAVAMDRMISAMAKRAGVSKVEMYGKLKFEKQSDFDNLLKTPNVVFQGTFGGSDASFVTLPEGISIVDGWYSPIEKRLRETKIERQSANKWLTSGLIGKGDEAIYTGVKGWLEGKNPQEQVSKQDILDWMQNNRVDIVEVVKEDLTEYDKAVKDAEKLGVRRVLTQFDEKVTDLNGNEIPYNELTIEQKRAIKKIADSDFGIKYKDTKFAQYQLEGDKENYKELLVTLPKADERVKVDSIKEEYEYERKGYYIETDANGQSYAIKKSKVAFKSSHFEEPNILVHLRMNTRRDADGNKILFLEEIQSDWGQTGKREGFKEDVSQKEKDDLIFAIKRTIEEQNKNEKDSYSYNRLEETANNLRKRLRDLQDKESKTPTAPFVTDTNAWTKLGLKMALREAVNQGAEKIAWTTGEQQNDRYSLENEVDFVKKRIVNGETFIDIKPKNTDGIIFKVDSNGNILENNGRIIAGAIGKNISEVIGKDVSERILLADKDSVLEGEGLKVGGKGMKGFYDGIVPNVAKSLVKELTGKPIEVGETKINKGTDDLTKSEALELLNQGEKVYTYLRGTMYRIYNESDLNEATNYFSKQGQATSKQQSIDITPELKSSVERGIPLFQAGMTGAKGAMQAMADGSFIVYALTDPNVSTPLHELAHVYEHYLTNDEKQTVIKNAGTKGWTTETSEYFARGFENYLAEGKSPIAELNKVFAKFKEWLLDIYNGIKGSEIDIKLNDEMRNIYDLMFKADERKTEEVKRPVEAPRVDERSVTKAFDAIEEAKRSRKTQRGKIEAGELAVKEMGDIGKKAIFIDNNFKDIIAKIKEFKNDKGDSLIKINCQ